MHIEIGGVELAPVHSHWPSREVFVAILSKLGIYCFFRNIVMEVEVNLQICEFAHRSTEKTNWCSQLQEPAAVRSHSGLIYVGVDASTQELSRGLSPIFP